MLGTSHHENTMEFNHTQLYVVILAYFTLILARQYLDAFALGKATLDTFFLSLLHIVTIFNKKLSILAY